MNFEKIQKDLQGVMKLNHIFLNNLDDEIIPFFEQTKTSEEYLQEEILIELIDKISRINTIISYLDKQIIEEGYLSRDVNGNIILNGKKLSYIHEIEVCFYDMELQNKIWTRVYVGMSNNLIGIDKNIEIVGMPARIRK